jgi:hypothetical protein
MPKRIAIVILIIFSCGTSQSLMACSCAPRDFGSLFRESDFVYVAEVTSVRLVTKWVPHNAQATYEVELRALRRFKGDDPGAQKATYTATYHDRTPDIATIDGERREFVINSCDHRYEVGQVFLIFQKRNVPLGNLHYCTPGFVSNPTAEHIRILEGLVP